MKKENGVTLITLAITIAILIILIFTITINAPDILHMKNKSNFENDMNSLKEEIDQYYARYDNLPIINKYTNISMIDNININDNKNYYVIDLSKIFVNLNYGKDYEKIKDKDISEEISDSDSLLDVYIINEQSHTIYYPKGIEYNDKINYTLDTYTQINAYIKASLEIEKEPYKRVKLIAKGIDVGDVGIDFYDFYINDKLEKTIETNKETATYIFDTVSGEYRAYVIIRNNEGKAGRSEVIKFSDYTIPLPEIKVSDKDIWTKTKKVTITTASGYTTKYTLDGTIPSRTNGTPYNGEFIIDKNCTITAINLDNMGEKDSESTQNVVTKIDTTPPNQATIDTNGYTADKFTTAATVTLTASATDNYGEIDYYEFSIDGGATIAATAKTYSISDAYYNKTVTARAVDKAGNIGPWSSGTKVKKGQTLSSVASAGQYVNYNGAKWRLYSKSGTTVNLVGIANSGYTLSGKSNYDNAVTLLNNQAKTKLDTTYATAARSINLNDNLATLVSWGFKTCWLANTHYDTNGVLSYYGINIISTTGTYGKDTEYENIYITHTNGATSDQPFTYSVAAIVTLKAGIVTSGNSGGYWNLVAPR